VSKRNSALPSTRKARPNQPGFFVLLPDPIQRVALAFKTEDRIDLAYLRADDPANVGSVR
jgi:hypothetical protein